MASFSSWWRRQTRLCPKTLLGLSSLQGRELGCCLQEQPRSILLRAMASDAAPAQASSLCSLQEDEGQPKYSAAR